MSAAFDPLSVICPSCDAAIGEPCTDWPLNPWCVLDVPHEQRIEYHNSEGRESTKAQWDGAVEKWGGV